ncbi:TonB-dependent receptor [Arenicella xantha]|uniref:Iron complex outermembrane receptor protein n=1 Tax=Arenicella xantha TaxID=644221 RepID=A0A395JSR6_9GAMM|nr:TonB-dependent receptor [Arenicella xantha]RBP51750.1 iron complex outermembrane receptor protein [Arenicella xantha]
MSKQSSPRLVPTLIALACVAASANTQAQSTDGESVSRLEEIIVTSRRISENLQDVPVAVSAFSDNALTEMGIENITDLQQRLPNTTLQVSRGTNTTLTAYIRGVGQQDPLWGFEPGVGVYVDDVYIARPQGAVLDILDVERVEVLRGPQGTLYGKNTIGGALKYVTRKLRDADAFSVEAKLGSYSQRDLKLSAAAPIVEDKFYIGGAVATLNRDGFGEFINLGEENYNKDMTAGRVSAEWYPSDSVSFRFTADRTEDNSNAKGGHRLTPSDLTGEPVLDDVFSTRAGMSTDNYVESEGYALHAEWAISDSLTFRSISATREGYSDTNIDFDNTALRSFDVPAIYEDDQTTQEFQLNYSGENWDLVSGLYYYTGEACGVFHAVLEEFAGGTLPLTATTEGCVETDSTSAYAQANWTINDSWSMTLGGRYTKDEKVAFAKNTLYLFQVVDFDNPPVAPGIVRTDATGSEDWSEFSPRIGFEYRTDSGNLIYASYSEGFKSGGFDMRARTDQLSSGFDPYDPETVGSFEIGFKADLLDDRLRTNIAYFNADYQDQQVTIQRTIDSGADFASTVLNAADSGIQGVELEMVYAVNDALTATLGVGLLDAEFDRVTTTDPASGQLVDVSNLWDFANTPDTSINLGFAYNRTVFSDWAMTFTGNVAYRSDTQIFEVPSALDEEAYSLFNAGLTFTSPDEKLWVSLQGKNLGDKEYRLAGYNFATTAAGPGLGGEDTVVGYYGDPRMISLSVGYRY